MSHKNYNSLNDIKINDFEIGLCPICNARLTSEKCPAEHMTDTYIQWQAVWFAVEQNRNVADEMKLIDPRTQQEKDLDEWQAEVSVTRLSDRPV